MSSIIEKISSKNPTGSDQKYEDTYLAIEAEIDKTMSASSAGGVDWTLISEHATQILELKSKDLKIASYWLYAQWKLSSWDGLEFALPLYTKLIATYKMKLFPKSTKVKLRILEWLHESLSILILDVS
jgi:type VI secretion system protein VasJ